MMLTCEAMQVDMQESMYNIALQVLGLKKKQLHK